MCARCVNYYVSSHDCKIRCNICALISVDVVNEVLSAVSLEYEVEVCSCLSDEARILASNRYSLKAQYCILKNCFEISSCLVSEYFVCISCVYSDCCSRCRVSCRVLYECKTVCTIVRPVSNVELNHTVCCCVPTVLYCISSSVSVGSCESSDSLCVRVTAYCTSEDLLTSYANCRHCCDCRNIVVSTCGLNCLYGDYLTTIITSCCDRASLCTCSVNSCSCCVLMCARCFYFVLNICIVLLVCFLIVSNVDSILCGSFRTRNYHFPYSVKIVIILAVLCISDNALCIVSVCDLNSVEPTDCCNSYEEVLAILELNDLCADNGLCGLFPRLDLIYVLLVVLSCS